MKKLAFIVLLLPCITHAQKWQIGLSGGVSMITKPRQAPPAYNDSKIKPGGAGMLSVAYLIQPHLELGLDVEAVNLVRTGDIVIYSGGSPVGVAGDARLYIGRIAFMLIPSLSYCLHHFYFGPQAGYFITSEGSNESFSSGKYYHYYYNSVRGLVAGAHVGYRRCLAAQLSLFGELRGNYVQGNQIMNGISYYGFNMMQLQLTVGIGYSL